MTDAAPVATKHPHTLHLTHESLQTLVRVMREHPPGIAPQKMVLWDKVWAKLARLLPVTIQVSWSDVPLDVYVTHAYPITMTPEQRVAGRAEWDRAMDAWKATPVDVPLSDKFRDACREGVKAVFESKEAPRPSAPGQPAAASKVAQMLPQTTATAELLVALGLADPVPDEE